MSDNKGYLVPARRDPKTGKLQWAVPGIVDDLVGAVTLPGEVYRGEVDPLGDEAQRRAFDLAGMASLGTIGPMSRAGRGMLAAKGPMEYDPPRYPQRPFKADYPGEVPADATGRLQLDIEGRPLTARYIAGRTQAGLPDRPLRSDELSEATHSLLGERVGTAAREDIYGSSGVTIPNPATGRPGAVALADDLHPDDIPRVLAHETGHVISETAGRIPTTGLMDELPSIYHAQATGERWSANPLRPQDVGYSAAQAPQEYMAEAIRNYLLDPNSIKTVAPQTAARIREYVNAHPEISKTIQFNTAAPLIVGGGLGAAALAPNEAQGETMANWWESSPIVEPSTMTNEQLRALAQARRRRAEAESAAANSAGGDRWWESSPIVQDANGQRYEGGVPVGGRGPQLRFPGVPATAGGNVPPLPPGFVMENGAQPDMARIKRNVEKMASMGAPEADIDGYIASEGTTIEAVRGFRGWRQETGSQPQATVPPLPPDFVREGQSTDSRFPGVPVQPLTFDQPAGDDVRQGAVRELARRELERRQAARGQASSTPAPLTFDKPDPKFGGVAMNGTAGLNEGLYGVAGLPVDVMRGAMNLASRGINAATGADLGQIPENSFGGSRWIGETMGAIRHEFDPANTVAATAAERVARGGGQGVGSVVAPAGVIGAMSRGGMLSARGASAGETMFGRAGSVGDAALGAVSGTGGAVGQEVAPEGYGTIGALAGSLIGGGVGYGAYRGAQEAVAPFHGAGREMLAARRLVDGASDQAALRGSLVGTPEHLVPGSAPTTFQRTGDLGIGAMEKDFANRYPDRFAARRGDQNAARVEAMRGIVPDGAPEKVAATVRQRLEAIEAETELAIGTATEQARQRTGAMGSPMTPEVAGGAMRGAIEEARAAAKVRENALWSAVDPDGTMTVPFNGTRESVRGVAREMTPFAQPMSEAERQVYGAIESAGDVIGLKGMRDLQSNLRRIMREERKFGETPALRRMSIVSEGIARDLDNAVAGKVTQEAQAVAAGRMSIDDTMMARFAAKRDGWFAERQATARSADGGGDPVGYGPGGQTSVSGVLGAGGQTRGRFGEPSRDPRLAGAAEGNFDAEALGRLNAANTATRERAGTFDNKMLGPIRRRASKTTPYDMPDGVVPAQIFNATARSPEAIARLRAAIGDQAATEAVQGYAVGQVLRAAGRPDGTLDPARLASWRRSHADALRALPELDAKLLDADQASRAIAEVTASRKAAQAAAQKSAVGRLLGVDAPEDVTKIVGGVFSRQDAVAQFRQLSHALGNDAEAKQGLRRAILDHMMARFVGNVEVGTSGIGGIRADGFQNFVRQNGRALVEAGFTPGQVRVLDAIAFDMQRAGRSISSVKNPGDPGTAQGLLAGIRSNASFSSVARLLGAPDGAGSRAALGGAAGLATGSMQGVAAGVAVGLVSAMRNAGLRKVDDLIVDVLLNPDRARLLFQKVPAGQEGEWLRKLTRSFAATAMREGGAVPATDATTPQPDRYGALSSEERKDRAVADALGIKAPPHRNNALADALFAMGEASPLKFPKPRRHDALIEALMGRA